MMIEMYMNSTCRFVAEIEDGKIIKRSDFLTEREARDFLEKFPPTGFLFTMDFFTVLTLRDKGVLVDRNERWRFLEPQLSSKLSSSGSDSQDQPRPIQE